MGSLTGYSDKEIRAIAYHDMIVANPSLNRAYRFGIAEAFNVVMDLAVDTLAEGNPEDVDRIIGMARSLQVISSVLETADKAHTKSLKNCILKVAEEANALKEDEDDGE